MSHYTHLTTLEREMILRMVVEGKSLRQISTALNRNVSTISREIARNKVMDNYYSVYYAEKKYQARRSKCKRPKLFENKGLREKVGDLFLNHQWSPEQISNRLIHENSPYKISYNTIYRGIYAGLFDAQVKGRAHRKLRHRGKTRRKKGTTETRGKMSISNTIHERCDEANKRKAIGHWEADTLAGKSGSACLVTLVDRHSRFLIAERVDKKRSQPVADKIIEALSKIPKAYLKSITTDRGTEFAKHSVVTDALNQIPFFFSDPHSPWQRGTNENTNGLLREYFAKSFDFSSVEDAWISDSIHKINLRPRKCLKWSSPFETFFSTVLHLT